MSTDLSFSSLTPAVLVSNNQLLFLGMQTVLSHVAYLSMAHNRGGFDKVIQQARPRLIILDMEPHTNATEMIRMVKDTLPHARILLLAGLEKIEGTVQVPELDVDGVVLRTQPPEVLLAVGRFFSGLARVKKVWHPQRETTWSPL